nr:hypothetical protein [Tanacetum cinerariifolium]
MQFRRAQRPEANPFTVLRTNTIRTSGSSLLTEKNGSEGGWIFYFRVGREVKTIREDCPPGKEEGKKALSSISTGFPSPCGLYSTHSLVSRTAQVSVRLRMRTFFPSAHSPFTRFSKQKRKGGQQACSLFFLEFMQFPLLHRAFFNRPTTLRAYGVFARRSFPVVPSSLLAIWAGCPSLLRSVRLWITGTNVVEWNNRRVTRSTVSRFKVQVVMITPGYALAPLKGTLEPANARENPCRRMLRSEIRSEIFDLPVPSRHGKERQKEERNYSLFSCPIPQVPEMHLLRPRERLLCQSGITALL